MMRLMMLFLIMVIIVIEMIATVMVMLIMVIIPIMSTMLRMHNLASTIISMRLTSSMSKTMLIVLTDGDTGNGVYARDDDSETGYYADNGERHD